MPDEVELSPLEWLRLALMDLEESRRVVACRRDERWAVSLSYPPDPRSSVIIAGIW